MKPVYVPRSAEEKAMQRALLQYFKPQNKEIVIKALIKAGRRDLIGQGKNCLVEPDIKEKQIPKQGKDNRKWRKDGQNSGRRKR